ncbi:speckle-type POZ protein-like isoform X2 [Phymastichus coffea]|uniref:speckle-type POZ protein-like isoform X2 n=1 Tax=Phymastichus coffea TaxID=108790 RepID=UPI00273B02A8|nr:speckle-type POZ protein-like isoform X2 [Phymastichus coffea]
MRQRLDPISEDSSTDSSDFWTTSTESSSSDSDDFSDYHYEPMPKKAKVGDHKNLLETESNFEHILKADFKWNIKNFNEICSKAHIGDVVESPIFITGSNEELVWRLELYPKGINEQNRNYLSLFLKMMYSKEPRLKVQYTFKLIIKKGDDSYMSEDYFIGGQRFGVKRFRKTDLVLKAVKNIEDSVLTITCEVNTQLGRTPIHRMKVLNDLEGLLDNGRFSDVTLNVKNTKFKVHKYILAVRSPVFSAMFEHDMIEKNQNIVQITDIEPEIMKELLRFTYIGEVKDLNSKAKDLLAAADKYAFDDLKSMCELSLSKNLNAENVIETLNFADLHSTPKLKEQALKYLVSHIKDVITTSSFKSFGNQQSPLLTQIHAAKR